ncbi:peroxiredoxin-like family protein [Humibacter albus]|uniref:peroxiredoxin-like family protein n=1 Tax=Humibacter albus TaxID=427754 RepID=UPI0003B720BA|nr:peroxiredoxin-like family protein [Humibacter albus]
MTETPIRDAVETMTAGSDRQDVWAREQAEQHRLHVHAAVSPGETFPDAELLTPLSEAVRLSEVIGGRTAVVVFYRGAWCPYCNLALSAYRRELSPILVERDAVLVAVSPQKPDGSLTMKQKHDLDFAVLSDPGNRLASLLGILTRPSDDARHAQLEHGLDLEQVNADGTTTLPMPTTAIVDRMGNLAWIDVHPDYSSRTEPSEIVAAMDRLGL